MLPQASIQSFYALFPVEKHRIDERDGQEIGRIVAKAAANGLAMSGGTMSLITTELANSIPERVSLSIKIMAKVFAVYDLESSHDNKSEVIALLEKLLRDQQVQARHKALTSAPFRTAPQAAKNAALRYIDLKANFESDRIRGEIDLMVAKRTAQIALDETAYKILAVLKDEFTSSERDAAALTEGYAGPSLLGLQDAIRADGSVSQVDFDLSLSALEKNKMITTGPVEPYDNPPGSSVVIFALVSKREYLWLTETGYRAANKSTVKAPPAACAATINIHGGTFNNSPVAAGTTITQTVNFDVTNESETVNYLYELLSHNNGNVDASAKQELKQMVEAANAGNMAAVRPIFQKLFGAVEGAAKEVATGVLTAIVSRQLGLGG